MALRASLSAGETKASSPHRRRHHRLLLMSRSREAARYVQPQFEQRTVNKAYLARVEGLPSQENFVSTAPIKRHKVEPPEW